MEVRDRVLRGVWSAGVRGEWSCLRASIAGLLVCIAPVNFANLHREEGVSVFAFFLCAFFLCAFFLCAYVFACVCVVIVQAPFAAAAVKSSSRGGRLARVSRRYFFGFHIRLHRRLNYSIWTGVYVLMTDGELHKPPTRMNIYMSRFVYINTFSTTHAVNTAFCEFDLLNIILLKSEPILVAYKAQITHGVPRRACEISMDGAGSVEFHPCSGVLRAL